MFTRCNIFGLNSLQAQRAPKRKKKDANAPKRAKSAFTIWSTEVGRQLVKEESPDLPNKEIMGAIGAKWKTLGTSSTDLATHAPTIW